MFMLTSNDLQSCACCIWLGGGSGSSWLDAEVVTFEIAVVGVEEETTGKIEFARTVALDMIDALLLCVLDALRSNKDSEGKVLRDGGIETWCVAFRKSESWVRDAGVGDGS